MLIREKTWEHKTFRVSVRSEYFIWSFSSVLHRLQHRLYTNISRRLKSLDVSLYFKYYGLWFTVLMFSGFVILKSLKVTHVFVLISHVYKKRQSEEV